LVEHFPQVLPECDGIYFIYHSVSFLLSIMIIMLVMTNNVNMAFEFYSSALTGIRHNERKV
jgi:hypothetical protein